MRSMLVALAFLAILLAAPAALACDDPASCALDTAFETYGTVHDAAFDAAADAVDTAFATVTFVHDTVFGLV